MNNPLMNRFGLSAVLAILLAGSTVATSNVGAASADLWQARNGTPDFPTTPIEWVKGNAGPANSHYVEGHSVPYRLVMTGLSRGSHVLVIEWDTRQKGKHAIDYVTHYDRLAPHNQFGAHTNAEAINPLDGIGVSFGAPRLFPIPAPSSSGSPVPGQPAASFLSLPPAERVMTIWNGTISQLAYVSEEPLVGDSAVTRLTVEFVADEDTVVIAWGGHIATKFDWGLGNSATSIGGSPYHMRKIDLDGAGGNQDRSLQAVAVSSPPTSVVTGPSVVCAVVTNNFAVNTDSTDPSTTYQWLLAGNTSDAAFVGATNGPDVSVVAGSAGAYSLQAVVVAGGSKGVGTNNVTVTPSTTASPLADQTVCPGSEVTFDVVPGGTAPFTFSWSKDGQTIPGATNSSLVLGNVGVANSGRYCVEVTGACGVVSRCATLTVETSPVLVGPSDLTVECLAAVPPPDPSSVQVSGGAGIVTVVHGGDALQTNDCDIIVTRTYQGVDTCASLAIWRQIITVRDTTPPTFAALPERSVECGQDWGFDTPSVSDECDGTSLTATVMGTVTNELCGKTFTATRTWQATDRCGNRATTSQTITVLDTTPPVITCLPDRNVECAAPWDFDLPSAIDICDGTDVTIAVTDTVPNALPGNLFRSTRTWEATDACGNTATCTQTITVMDTTAPEIACATNTIVPCTGPEGATVPFEVTATDACDAGVQVVCVPPSGSLFALGTNAVQCVATDVNGNASQCSFTVTIIDIVPPSLTCPANAFVVEDPPGSGSAAFAFPSPVATDNCDPNPVVVCLPPSGAALPVGDTTVVCVATDASGNTNACSFQVRVVPRVIVASSLADSGPGSLRQALLDANAAPGSNVIAFAFPGGPPFVIHLLSPLPPIVDSVAIDGWSQLEFVGEPVIELDGSNVVTTGANSVGLSVVAGDSEVRGLVLNGFEVGLRVAGPGRNIIQGNFIGAAPGGATAAGNSGDGLQIYSPGNLVGGDDPATRNVISGNHGNGIVLDGSNAVDNVVAGNFIGVADDGTTPRGNGGNGVVFRNGAADNRVGPDNVIAFNALSGLLLEPSAGNGNAIRGNAIFSNGALGIDLGGDGVTPNDDSDDGTGPNRLQNFPVLVDARLVDGMTVIVGTLNSTANSTFQVDFFLNTENVVEGRDFLGSLEVMTDADGHAAFSITLPISVPADHFITATATDAGNNTSEFSGGAKVDGPPVIVVHPVGSAVTPGASVNLCVTATGSQPLTYQWRLNGANILDATNSCHSIPNAQLMDGGSYTVVVANDFGVVTSDPAVVRLILPAVPAGDNFVDRVRLTGASGLVAWNNTSATREPGEPNHVGKPGGKSIWYTWTAPATGVATFSAVGSAFDTLLAVYNGNSVTNLTLVESDEDRGGFFTSVARFNVIGGVEYQIAIDGFGAEFGECVFSWLFVATTKLLPVIFYPPTSQTVAPGATVTFKVDASVDCREPHYSCRRVNKDQPPDHPGDRDPLTYQWKFNGVPIPGATQSSLTVTNIQDPAVGRYSVVVTGDGPSLETLPAILQINDSGSSVQNVQATDKFLDAAIGGPLRLGTPAGSFAPSGDPNDPSFVPAVAVRSYTSTQVFSSAGGTTSAGELLPCYGVGGASEWFGVVAEESGVMYVNTDGSSYDTVLAVYTYSPGGSGLDLLGCDNNSGLDKRDSAVAVPVQAGQTNFIVIDGYNGAYGTARLNCSLVTAGSITPMGFTVQKAMRLRLTGQPAMRFTLQTSSNLVNWTSLVTNSSSAGLFDYIDSKSTNAPRRYYRALMLP
jgi:hypothetical protein